MGSVPAASGASRQDGRYPRPQLLRERWHELSGTWGFAFDDADTGETDRWYATVPFESTIQVPFPFESVASGIHDTGFHDVIWYSRRFGAAELAGAGLEPDTTRAQRVHLRFGAVDYRARVWIDGGFVGEHEGGHTPFSFDITDALDPAAAEHTVVVRATDDPLDTAQPRGKQDWRLEPHSIWYHRTSGIWQPVWLEVTGAVHVTLLHWTPDLTNRSVRLRVGLNQRPPTGAMVRCTLSFEGSAVADVVQTITAQNSTLVVTLPTLRNGRTAEELLWTPETPRLIDAEVSVELAGVTLDNVRSYLGLRSATVSRGRFLLNDRPYYVRAVLQQGYWPQSHLASPHPGALRRDVELIKGLGFTAARVHQKIEDPRFLYWADRLGLLVWAEAPGTVEFGPTAMRRTVAEWTAVLERDYSHPCIVTWVPLNESWGVPQLAHDPVQAHFARALAALTRAADPSRPVVSNDGWEHVDSDIVTVHDYTSDGDTLGARYRDGAAIDRLLSGPGPAGRRILLPGQERRERPVMLTEFGGISTAGGGPDAWGYSTAASTDDFLELLRSLLGGLGTSTVLAGFCYTQLTDTRQETNGLLDENRTPKAPLHKLRAIIRQEQPGPSPEPPG